ncbi:MAG: hypothetical protein HYR67_18710 [Bacteroidetes bacterium]|nr:hypothetical protein [Bacteroidota bacterium]
MKKVFSMRSLSIAAVAAIAMLACSKKDDNPLSSTDSQNVNSESVSASTSSETSDLGNSVIGNVSDTQLASARESGKIDGLGLKDRRLLGATITISGTGTRTNPSGTVTIDFGTGVTTDGITRKGKIIIEYHGRRLQPNSTRSITFNGYYRNSVKVEGTYSVTVSDSTKTNTDVTISFDHTTNLTLTFDGGTTITRTATFTAVWDYVISNPTQSTITHKTGGGATGSTRKGDTYTMAITKDLVYRADCFAAGFALPLTGTKTISVVHSGATTGNLYTIDYGTTTCDNTVTVTFNGKSKTITVGNDGN